MTPVNKQWENLKNDYIRQVEKALSSVKHPRIKEILEDVREHLDRRFWELSSDQQTIENLKSIIAEMGPASEYAELLEPQVVKKSHKTHKKYFVIAGIAAIVVIAIAIPILQPKHSSLRASTLSDKISKFDIDSATLEDVIDIFGKPQKYLWGDQTYTKDNLPSNFIMRYPDNFSVYMSNNKVVELRHSGSESSYLWQGKLKVGDALTKVFEKIGKPNKTVEGQENQYESGVLYKDIEGNAGHCYYARSDLNLRLWFRDYILMAIYMTRSDYGQEDEREKAVISPTSIIDENGRIVDKIDYSFVNDSNVIGAWKSVDFVGTKEEFKPGEKHIGELWLKHLIFEENGKETGDIYTWTKGLVISKSGKTASAYDIKKIGNAQYMFFEWKSGDYTIRHWKPKYYVLKKVSLNEAKSEAMFGDTANIPTTSTIDENGRVIDKIDYPFENDPKVIGTWKSVDFVESPEEFEPGSMRWQGSELFLKELVFQPDGKMDNSQDKWTKGLVLDIESKTASKYIIKQINGSTYMFYEWKSGDYTIRRMKPKYYVLKKE